jgi:hypothetical protein
MKKVLLVVLGIFYCLVVFVSCTKNGKDVIYTSVPKVKVANPISDSLPLNGAYHGHMVIGKTYTVAAGSNIVVNVGDTLIMDAGTKLYMSPASSIVVKGIFISLGTHDNPNWITVKDMVKTDAPNVPAGSDSAYTSKRLWCGINCDTSCSMLVLKWTHVEYTSANFVGTPPLPSTSGTSHAILFQNPNGVFVMEDSWLYGSADEVRVSSGRICIMRNTIEKFGFTGGDGFNCKHASTGDMAYNLFIGVATNGTKASDKGSNAGPQTNLTMYNNTYVNGGYRRSSAGRGGSINYEEGSKGLVYNNIIVNCKYGLRIVNNPPADTVNMHYGNTLSYGDSASIVNQFYPQGYITKPQPTDIPAPASFLPTPYTLGQVYSANSVIGANNPMFVNYPLPAIQGIANIAYATGFDFRLKPTSPAINKGYQGFSPLGVVPIDPVFGATEITPPGKDLGCYQSNGSGNQH